MSEAVRWLEGRAPRPPDDLADAMVTRLEDGPTAEVLLDAACRHLDAARAHPGRVRQSAFDLLVADGLVTYACEAALDAPDPEEALARLFSVGSVR